MVKYINSTQSINTNKAAATLLHKVQSVLNSKNIPTWLLRIHLQFVDELEAIEAANVEDLAGQFYEKSKEAILSDEGLSRKRRRGLVSLFDAIEQEQDKVLRLFYLDNAGGWGSFNTMTLFCEVPKKLACCLSFQKMIIEELEK